MTEWHKTKELSAGYLRLRFLFGIYRIFGVTILKIFIVPVTFVTFLFATTQRKASREYFTRLYNYTGNKKYKPASYKTFRHFLMFAFSLVDRLRAWGGQLNYSAMQIMDPEVNAAVFNKLASQEGFFILSSHLGNIEMFRGVCHQEEFSTIKINAFIDLAHTQEFNRFLKDINPSASTNVFSSTDVGIHTALLMQEKIQEGEIVVMAADRQPSTSNRGIEVILLGEKVVLPLGVFKFATLMECDIYSFFICQSKGSYEIHILKYTLTGKKDDYKKLAQVYADKLEQLMISFPYQWFNFYDYWREP